MTTTVPSHVTETGRSLRTVLLLLFKAPAPLYADELKCPRNPEGVGQPARFLNFAVRQGLATRQATTGGERYSLTDAGRSLAQGFAAAEPQGRPNPTQVMEMARAEGTASHRNVYCSTYSTCVTTAARKGWLGFSCQRCPFFTKDNRPPAEQFMRRDSSIGA